ncbi:hypothetical protein FRB98_008854 [Tulasnella sp. 332]|nr:hypothetical protein FRB98_008854 [Tulasnella sp. 332]
MSTNTSTTPAPIPAYTDDDARVLFPVYAPPPGVIIPLRLPLCIPQLSIGMEAPFARAYSAEILQSGIEQDDLLKFIDGLNMAMLASPPLRVVNTVGMALDHWTIIASISMQAGARAGAKALSKGLTDRYLRIANETYFAPRGLRIRLCRTSAVRQIVGLDPAQNSTKSSSTLESLKTTGIMIENAGLSIPIVRNVIVRCHPPPKIDTTIVPDATKRRVASLEGRCLPLDYDMPPPKATEGQVNKMNALGVKMSAWMDGRDKAKANRARDMLAGRQTQTQQSASSSTESQQPSQMQNVLKVLSSTRIGSRLSSLNQRREARSRITATTMLGKRRLKSKVAVADRKEVSASIGMLWIVVLNADQDKLLGGTDLADSPADVEEILTEEWQHELDLEDDEDEDTLDDVEESTPEH